MKPVRSLVVLVSVCVVATVACSPDDSTGAVPDRTPGPLQMAGVIEGFYGPPWSHEDRLDVLRFMGRVGLSAYFYAPKNDPFHRTRWRDPYPDSARAELADLIETADANGVTFWYAISPGLSMTYSDSGDYAALVGKLDAVAALGTQHVALFLDDVPATLRDPADTSRYPSLADAHVDLINRLHSDMRARGRRLVVTPTTYTGAWGDREYAVTLGAGVVQDVELIWTGPDVASPVISAREADAWGSLLARPPLLWDNYPVNDFARWRLFLGPLTGRTGDLGGAVSGLIANPMNEAHASMIPLTTLAWYASDPSSYAPDPALSRRAARELLGPAVAAALGPFLDVYGPPAWDDHVFEPLYMLRDTIPVGPVEAALSRLDSSLAALRGMAGDTVDRLVSELTPFPVNTRARLEAIAGRDDYRLDDGHLVYRSDRDVFHAPLGAPIRIDGDIREFSGPWHSLRGRGTNGAIQLALAADDESLYLAVRAAVALRRVHAGDRVGEGDHVAIVTAGEESPHPTRMGTDNLVLLFAPPGDDATPPVTARSMTFEGFMAKWLGDNENLTFTEFHLTSMATAPTEAVATVSSGTTYAARPTGDGYVMEIRLPREGRSRIRLNLTVATTDSRGRRRYAALSNRNYPANPETYATIAIGEPPSR